jgi:putative hydroxymethylpyrimidine transport system substrate-binding protein
MFKKTLLMIYHAACRVTKPWGYPKGEKRSSPTLVARANLLRAERNLTEKIPLGLPRGILLFLLFFSSLTYALENTPTLTLVLDWFINADHAPILVAQQQGYFQQAGIQVKLIEPADPSDGPKMVAAGKADIAITYQPQFMMQVDQGLPLTRIGSLVDQPLDCVVALAVSGIHNLGDLKGKTVGYSAGGIDSLMLKTMLQKPRLNLSDIKFINVRYALVQALLSGNIDAFTGGMRNVEPIQLKKSGHSPVVFYPELNGFPSYEELIFVINPKNQDDRKLGLFLAALQKGVVYLQQHPQQAWEAAIARYPVLNNPINKASWMDSVQYFSHNPAQLDATKYQTFAEFLQQQKLIQSVPELSTYTKRIH